MNLIFLETILLGVNLLVKLFKWDFTFSLITILITNYCASSKLISCYTFHFIDANIYCEGDDALRENYKWNCNMQKKMKLVFDKYLRNIANDKKFIT